MNPARQGLLAAQGGQRARIHQLDSHRLAGAEPREDRIARGQGQGVPVAARQELRRGIGLALVCLKTQRQRFDVRCLERRAGRDRAGGESAGRQNRDQDPLDSNLAFRMHG